MKPIDSLAFALVAVAGMHGLSCSLNRPNFHDTTLIVEPSTDIRKGSLRLPNGKTTQVSYSVVDDLAIFEGDMILGRASDAPNFNEASPGVQTWGFGYGGGWTSPVRYCIDGSVSNPSRVRNAAAHWSSKTKFQLMEDPNCHAWGTLINPSHIDFVFGGGCRSYVAYRPGSDMGQPVYLANECSERNVRHEIGHALGLLHEHSRTDRNSYIQIDISNVIPSERYNFNIVNDGTLIGPYNYDSIMHYGAYEFAIDRNKPTIIVPNNQAIGKGQDLSPGDIAAANIL